MFIGILPNAASILLYGGILTFGILLIVLAIISLLRSFTPGRQERARKSSHPLLGRGATYSLGLGATLFGAVGLLATLFFSLDTTAIFLLALIVGLVTGVAALGLLVYWPSRGRVEDTLLDFDAIGLHAQVVIPIPSNGIGEVTFAHGVRTINLAARSASGQSISEGVTVIIERVTHRVAVVILSADKDHIDTPGIS